MDSDFVFLVPQMIYLLDRNQIISHSSYKSEIHPALSDITKFISLSIHVEMVPIFVQFLSALSSANHSQTIENILSTSTQCHTFHPFWCNIELTRLVRCLHAKIVTEMIHVQTYAIPLFFTVR